MSYGYPLDLALLQQLLGDADAEAEARAGARVGHRVSVEALHMELWRQRYELIASAAAHQRQTLDVARPFARIADLIDRAAGRVTLSTPGRPDFARLKPTDFFRARDLVRSA